MYNQIVNTLTRSRLLLGVVNDPTTAGVKDSNKALTYDKPKGDDHEEK